MVGGGWWAGGWVGGWGVGGWVGGSERLNTETPQMANLAEAFLQRLPSTCQAVKRQEGDEGQFGQSQAGVVQTCSDCFLEGAPLNKNNGPPPAPWYSYRFTLLPPVPPRFISFCLCLRSLSLSLFLFVLVGRTGWKRERGLRAWGRALPLRHCHFHWATRNLTPFSSRGSGQNLESRAM